MDLSPSPLALETRKKVEHFFETEILPRDPEWRREVNENGNPWPDFLLELRAKAKSQGLWNLGLPMLEDSDPGTRLNNLEYTYVADVMGRLGWSSFAFNCQPPDVPNAEILQQFGTPEQKEQWLAPLLNGEIRSTFAMTEPAVASSDANNIETTIQSDGDHYVINGRKWWTSNASHPMCKFAILVGLSDPEAERGRGHTMVLIPTDTPGFKVERTLSVFGAKDITTPHDQVLFDNVRIPKTNLLGTEGGGFLIGQARLGPARIQHCMRMIGHGEVLVRLMLERARDRVAFGKPLQSYSTVQEWIAESRLELEQCKLMLQKTAWLVDNFDNKAARREVSMIKLAVPRAYSNIADRAVQVFGGLAASDDGPFASAVANARVMRIADGPDEVHLRTLFKLEQFAAKDEPNLSPSYLRGPGNIGLN